MEFLKFIYKNKEKSGNSLDSMSHETRHRTCTGGGEYPQVPKDKFIHRTPPPPSPTDHRRPRISEREDQCFFARSQSR